MTTQDFITTYDPCEGSHGFLNRYDTIAQAWNACDDIDWILWLVGRHNAESHYASVVQFIKDCTAYAAAVYPHVGYVSTAAAPAAESPNYAARAAIIACTTEFLSRVTATDPVTEKARQVARLKELIPTP